MYPRIRLCACFVAAAPWAIADLSTQDIPEAVRKASNESETLLREGRYAEAGAVLQHTLKAVRPIDPEGTWTAVLLNNLGAYYLDIRDCDEGRSAFRQSLKILEQRDNPMLFMTAVNFGSLLIECGQLGDADRLWQNVLEARARMMPETDMRLARALVFRANLLLVHKQYAACLPVAERALAIWQKEYGPGDVHSISMLNTLSMAHSHLARHDEAIHEQRLALDLLERAHGGAHPSRARLYVNLSTVYSAAGQYEAADENSRKAVEIAVARFGRDNAITADILLNRADLLRRANRKAEAAVVQRDARAILANSLRGRAQTVDVRDLAQ